MIIIGLIIVIGIGLGIYSFVDSIKDAADAISENKKKRKECEENYRKMANGTFDEEISYYKKP